MPRIVYLTDPAGKRLATLEVDVRRRSSTNVSSEYLRNLIIKYDFAEGVIVKENFPDHARMLFQEFQEIADGQILSLLDQIDEKIASLNYRVEIPPDIKLYRMEQLHIYDLERISFFIADPVQKTKNL